jgi:hypothetical protein
LIPFKDGGIVSSHPINGRRIIQGPMEPLGFL